MQLDQVLAELEVVTGLLGDGRTQTLEQGETCLKNALEVLQTHMTDATADRDDLGRVYTQCRRIAGLLGAAGDFYMGLSGAINIQAVGYGSTGAKIQSGSGRRFVIDA